MEDEKYIVASKDGKWFFTGKYYFSDREEDAVNVSEDEASDFIKDVTTMELEMRKVA